MECASCGRSNPAGARFCGGCGTSLAPRCPACGAETQADARFCFGCGAALAAQRPAATAVSRKIVTIVFADLIGSVSLHERLDAESARRVMDRYHRAMSAAVDVHGGRVVQLLGDGVLAAFGVPRVAEDDAIRAVRAAVGMQRAFRELARELGAAMQNVGLRVAVNTGEIVVGDDENSVMGDPTNVAARLQQEARDGDVIVGEGTQRLVAELVTLAPLGVFALRGRAETVAAYRVVSLDRPASQQAIAFVGRDEELRRLVAVYDAAVATPAARLAVLLGSPGLGKSRLVAEFTRRAGERATVLAARCDADGGATFAPLAEALRVLLRIDEGAGGDVLRAAIDALVPGDESERSEDGQRARGERSEAERARIATGLAALLSGAAASPEETFFAVRRLLAALAGVRPVVLVIDDLHWAEPLLLDLVEHLVQWSSGVPLLVLVAARPELRDTRSSLTMPGPLVAEVVTLTGLDAGAATRLAANVIGGSELPAALAGRVLATSEGNPLFVAELVRMLVLDGTLVREGERWITTVEVSKLDMPATIQVLLAARIERLRPEERSVLERAAVIGRVFSRAAVAHLLPRETHDLDARLEALRRSELIEPDTGWFLGEPALRFHHVLIRDAAYRRVLKETRAELHERLADWIVARVGETVEHDETIGWHLEQAHQNLRELGPLDAHGTSLGERAARHLGAAGRRALARDDLALAAGLLGRAIDRLDPGDSARADLALDWCEALLSAGDVGAAAAAIDELGRFIDGEDRLRAWHTCFAGQLAALTDPQALRATADAVAAAAEALTSAGDAAGEAKAHSVHAIALARLGKVGACEAALDRALAAARRAHDRRRANGVLAGAPLAALWGPSPVTRASGRCLDVVRVLRITQGAPAVEAIALQCQGVLEALRGRTEAARRMIASSRQMVEKLGITHRLLDADVFAGRIELLEDDAVAAERCLRSAYDGLRDLGLGIDAARAAALLARALLAQGRAAEAETLSHESEALAGDDLQSAIAWRGVRAEALARRGEYAAAVELARAAVEIAAATDALLDHADARLALAAALRAAGRGPEADAEEVRAIELWDAKGATLLSERARRSDGRTAEVGRAPDARAESACPVQRRVRANAATAHAAREDAAFAARDFAALATLFADELEVVDHPNGATHDRLEHFTSLRTQLGAQVNTSRHEPLATLGDALALCRHSVSSGGFVRGNFDVGAYDYEGVNLFEVDAQGRCRLAEFFAGDHLDDAVARLYERYAELLPEGPEQSRAAATARSVAALFRGPDRWPLAQDVEAVDHRTVGFGSLRGADAALHATRTLVELSDDFSCRVDDVLDLEGEALFVRWTTSGTIRASGGTFERSLCQLFFFGADGQVTRWEQFDAEQDTEALARFDELTAAAKPPPRRVRANAATAKVARLDAAIAAHDADALPALFADEMQVVNHHLAGGEYDRQGALATWRSLLSAEGPTCRHEPLATLGDSLALCRQTLSASGFAGGKLDVGAFEREEIVLIEVDGQGRGRRSELFASDHLGDAIARLYEFYAELLPVGPERERAAATARSVAAYAGSLDLDRLATAFAPAIEGVDHRILGTWSARGAGALLEGFRAIAELSDDIVWSDDAVLGLQSDALLVRRTHSGTARASGGVYERPFLLLRVFGADGLVTHIEWFDTGHDAEALARFDALTAAAKPAPRRVRANAATANAARLDAAVAARDGDAFPILFADGMEMEDHSTHVAYDRQGELFSFRSLLRARDPKSRHEPLATLGDSLALCRASISSSGFADGKLDVGAHEREGVFLIEVDEQGRRRRGEFFAADHLGDAIARLYERYAELLPEGSARERAAATARSVAVMAGPFDPDRYAAAMTPSLEFVDHRTVVGIGSARGAAAYLDWLRTLSEVAAGVITRLDDVLALRPDAALVRRTTSGSDRAGGGAFERQLLQIWVFGTDGLITREEHFDADREAEALARFDALTAAAKPPPRHVRANAATVYAAREDAAFAARHADTLATLFTDELEVVEHPNGVTLDQQEYLTSLRRMRRAQDLTRRNEPLASLGDALALCRMSLSASGIAQGNFDVGAYEVERVVLFEVDAQGRCRRRESYAADRVGDAIARLYERYTELLPEGPARTRAAATARSAAAYLMQPWDPDRYAAAFAPAIEVVDHRILGTWSTRGVEAAVENIRSWLLLTDDGALREGDILRLQSDALLAYRTFFGTDRASGGSFEREFLQLWVFGSDGLFERIEYFDSDRDAEALARFDELTAEPAKPRPLRRRVRDNAATASAARYDAAIAARDEAALADVYAEGAVSVHHATGTVYDRDAGLARSRAIFRAENSRFETRPLATLGDSLALGRSLMSADGLASGSFDVGPYEADAILLTEADAHGRRVRLEHFEVDHLGDAVARLYERYAELLADGPARTRAATTARSVAGMLATPDLARRAAAFAPDIEFVDHRIVGVGSVRGADAVLRAIGALHDLVENVGTRLDDLIDMRADAIVLRWTHFGTTRDGGGRFERSLAHLWIFGADGRLTRWEQSEGERVDELLARLDELTAEPSAALRVCRRVQANAATAHAARLDIAIVAQDAGALPTLFSAEMAAVDHITHTEWDRQAVVSSWRSLALAETPTSQHEPLATLGDSLLLCRMSLSASRLARRSFDVGGYEKTELHLIAVDAPGQRRWTEVFAVDHLGDAIARLYERYAERLPDGPERTRAEATARSVAAMLGTTLDPDRYATAFAPAVECVDHRTLATFFAVGADALLAGFRSWFDLVAASIMCGGEILSLQPHALLMQWNFSCTDRAGGGAVERSFIWLLVFGTDGLMTRIEYFEADREAEALARFDVLAAAAKAAPRRVRPNAAVANLARADAAFADRNAEALSALFAAELEFVDHTTGTTWDAEGVLATWRSLMSAREPTIRRELLATLGDSLALSRLFTSASGFAGSRFDVGAYEKEELGLVEVDAQGLRRRSESFAVDHLGDAVVRLYERYAELLPEGPARVRAAATARSVAAALGPYDTDRYDTAHAATIEYFDHRAHGVGSLTGVDAVRHWFASLLEVAEGVANRSDDVLGLRSDALLLRRTNFGIVRASGGSFERFMLWLGVFGADGLMTHLEIFEGDRDADALARFDALTAEPADAQFANAASRAAEQALRTLELRDWDALVALYAPEHVFDDRRPLVRTRVEGEAYFAELRRVFHALRASSLHLIATRGDRLALYRHKLTSVSGDGGPAEFEMLNVIEVDAAGRRVALVTFDLSDLDAAYAELDARYAAGEAAPFSRNWEAMQRVARAFTTRDWENMASVYTQDFVLEDHRLLGWGTRSRDEFLAQLPALAELAPDTMLRADHYLAINHRGVLGAMRWVGSRDGGAFEIPIVLVTLLGPDGRIRRSHAYDPGELGAARACFDALTADPLRIPPNAATRVGDRWQQAIAAERWETIEALLAPTLVFEDRRRGFLTTGDREMLLANDRLLASWHARFSRTVLATAGDCLALAHVLVEGTHQGGAVEGEFLQIIEVDGDGDGRIVAVIAFDLDDRRAASAEMYERFARSDASGNLPAGGIEYMRALRDRDLDRVRAQLPDDFFFHDHRRTGTGRLGSAEYVAFVAALFEQSPDVLIEGLYTVAVDAHGILDVGHLLGTRDGGEFESVFARIVLQQGGRVVGTELFEVEDLDIARVRFEELRPDPTRIPPNAATRASDRIAEAIVARDWDALRALASDEFRYEDHSRWAQVGGDVEVWIASTTFLVSESAARAERELLGTVGDRIALYHTAWRNESDGTPFELDKLRITEVDANGKLRAFILFDPSDRSAAFEEAQARFLAGEAAATGGQAPLLAWSRAIARRDWEATRECLAPDFVHYDHRTLVSGSYDRDQSVESMRTWRDLAPDAALEELRILTWNRHGRVEVARSFGTTPDGVVFENVMVFVALTRGDCIQQLELFDVGDADRALARFAELCAP